MRTTNPASSRMKHPQTCVLLDARTRAYEVGSVCTMSVNVVLKIRELCGAVSGDWVAIARSAVFDGLVEWYRFYQLTLTAPSFGRVHRVPRDATSPVQPCTCGVQHTVADADLSGVPLDRAGYNYSGLVAWNRDSACGLSYSAHLDAQAGRSLVSRGGCSGCCERSVIDGRSLRR